MADALDARSCHVVIFGSGLSARSCGREAAGMGIRLIDFDVPEDR